MKNVLLLAGLEFVVFLLATLNFRAYAKGHVGTTSATDGLIAAVGFVLVKLVVEARTPLEMAGYVVGACAGSFLGMRLTRSWKDVG